MNNFMNVISSLGQTQQSGQSSQSNGSQDTLNQANNQFQDLVQRRNEQASQSSSIYQQKQSQQQQSTANTGVALATSDALAGGADPVDLAIAKAQLGDQDYINYCEQFVENTQGKNAQFPNAISAWNSYAQSGKAKVGLNGIQPGDILYFSPNSGNGNNGHTGIYAGGNQFISATDNGIQQTDLGQWSKSTGQQILGYVPT